MGRPFTLAPACNSGSVLEASLGLGSAALATSGRRVRGEGFAKLPLDVPGWKLQQFFAKELKSLSLRPTSSSARSEQAELLSMQRRDGDCVYEIAFELLQNRWTLS